MSQDNRLDMRADRREFLTLAAALAVLGGVSITISACGGSGGASPAAPSTPAPTPTPVADKNGVIANNHGHVALITGAQMTAASSIVLHIQGTASHDHTVELSSDDVGQIRDGRTVARMSTATSHSHMVTFN
jgi:hypothetical protein